MLGASTRALCVPAPIISAGRGGRSQPADSLCPGLGGPGARFQRGAKEKFRGPGPPQVRVCALWPQARGKRCVLASARSWRRCDRGSVPRGGVVQPARSGRSGRKECPGRTTGAPHLGRGATLVLCVSPCLRAVPPGRGQIRCRGAPAAAPQPESPPSGRTAARARRPRPPSDPTGKSSEAAPLPRVRRTHLGWANPFFGPGSRLRLASPVPSDRHGASCHES
ncbi:hypothetical protein NDU88_002593 [Pleurodeles waltl]|uniref:Uncharacterized protein n=1 Tax=Pleurodeles waltl TaxID=8319 RepID=A0AAV7MBG1_PLEWA|nr:hypothetical protein NDU88_002593 [Pleurodeles waltl]